jgi:hypothetical protein
MERERERGRERERERERRDAHFFFMLHMEYFKDHHPTLPP